MLKNMEMRESRTRLINDKSAQYGLPMMDLKIVSSPLAQSGHQQTFQKFPKNSQPPMRTSRHSKSNVQSPQSQRFKSPRYQAVTQLEEKQNSTIVANTNIGNVEKKELTDRYGKINETLGRAERNESKFKDANSYCDMPTPVAAGEVQNPASNNASPINLSID